MREKWPSVIPLLLLVVQGEVTGELCTECKGLPYVDMVRDQGTWSGPDIHVQLYLYRKFLFVFLLWNGKERLWLGARSFHKAGRDQSILGEISYVAALGVGRLLSYMLHILQCLLELLFKIICCISHLYFCTHKSYSSLYMRYTEILELC